MKTLLLASVLALGATAASAADFDRTELVTKFSSGKLEFAITADNDGLSGIETTAYITQGPIWGTWNSYTAVSLGYDKNADTMSLGVEGGLAKDLDKIWTVYGIAELAYVADTSALSDGDVFFSPSLGVAATFDPRWQAFAEVGYSWDVSNSFNEAGGYAEVGLAFLVTEEFSVAGSIVKPIDTANDDAFARIETSFRF